MSGETDRRFFALCLLVLLCVSFVLSGMSEKRLDSETERTRIEQSIRESLDNKSLEITVKDERTFYIDGVGELTSADLRLLLSSIRRDSIDVVHLVIGDEIDEIAYDTINGYKYLQTLKIGNKVQTIHNGAIRNCPELKAIYIPSAVQWLPQDFLNGCGNCLLITDGEEIKLPDYAEIDASRIYTNIKSYNDLEVTIQEQKVLVASFDSTQIGSTDKEAGNDPMQIRPGFVEFSPYIILNRGFYIIETIGDNFRNLSTDNIFCINHNLDEAEVVAENIEIEDNRIRYHISPDSGVSALELGIVNNTVDILMIESVCIYDDVEYALIESLVNWW